MRGWSVLGSVLLMGSGALVWSLLMFIGHKSEPRRGPWFTDKRQKDNHARYWEKESMLKGKKPKPNKNCLKKNGNEMKIQSYERPKELGLEREEHRKGGRASPRSTRPADDAKCSGTPSGGCVVGRCWEACSSWVPVSLVGLSLWPAG